MKKEKRKKHFIKKPYYKGGIHAMKDFITKHLNYPDSAKDKKIEGTVNIRYTVNYKGKVIGTKIISGIGFGCDEEAVRLVKLLEFNVPRNRNIKAVFHKNLQIHFILPKEKEKPASATGLQYYYTLTPSITAKKTEKKTGYIITMIQ